MQVQPISILLSAGAPSIGAPSGHPGLGWGDFHCPSCPPQGSFQTCSWSCSSLTAGASLATTRIPWGFCLLVWTPAHPPALYHSPSQSSLLTRLHPLLSPIHLQKLCLLGTPQPPHLPGIQKGQQQPENKKTYPAKTMPDVDTKKCVMHHSLDA